MLLQIPDTMARWPWPRRINPWHAEVIAESKAWLHSFSIFTPARQAAFDACKVALLGALVYPDVSKEELRSACDLMHLFFVIDDQTDEMDVAQTQELADTVLEAMKNPEHARPDGETLIGEIARQFWIRASARATAQGKARFMDTWVQYLSATVEQSRDREEGRVRTAMDYLALRRSTIGVVPTLALAMINSDLPLGVYDLPTFCDLQRCITDLVLLENDMLSFSKEYLAGDVTHNIVSLAMREQQIDVQSAIFWLGAEHSLRVDEVLVLWPKISSLVFGSDAVSVYLDHMVNWPRANECWSFESERYFGTDGPDIKRQRIIDLRMESDLLI
ncbi:terpenoid synthase [Trametes gibbosa]|nr:terpenoid synthase [Trametes gibbosa]